MDYPLPNLIISKELIERIQFSVSSRNAQAKLGECVAHVFAAQYSDNPHDINWQYVSSGMACLLRNRELAKNGRKYMWSISLCLYNASYGVLVWKAKLLPNSDYTAVAGNFHVFALGEVNVLVGLMFSSKDGACELHTTYTKWHQERMRDDGKKKGSFSSSHSSGAEPIRFRKEMISKPCNFQHIQGTQAIDECMDIEKIKADIVAAFFGLGTKAGRLETDVETQQKSKKKKKEPAKPRLEFKEIILPQMHSPTSPPAISSPIGPPQGSSLSPVDMPAYAFDSPHMIHQNSQQALSPLSAGFASGQFNLAEEVPNDYQDESRPYGGVNPLQQQPSSTSLGGYDPNYGHGSEQNGYPSAGYGDEGREGIHISQSRQDSRKGMFVSEAPNYQNPASPAFQEYGGSSQDSYPYNIAPPRLDMSLEKEFAESALFKPSLMTAI